MSIAQRVPKNLIGGSFFVPKIRAFVFLPLLYLLYRKIYLSSISRRVLLLPYIRGEFKHYLNVSKLLDKKMVI